MEKKDFQTDVGGGGYKKIHILKLLQPAGQSGNPLEQADWQDGNEKFRHCAHFLRRCQGV